VIKVTQRILRWLEPFDICPCTATTKQGPDELCQVAKTLEPLARSMLFVDREVREVFATTHDVLVERVEALSEQLAGLCGTRRLLRPFNWRRAPLVG